MLQTYDHKRSQPVFELENLYFRNNPIFHDVLSGYSEHRLLMGMPIESKLNGELKKSFSQTKQVSMTNGGCNWLHAVVQIKKKKGAYHNRFKEKLTILQALNLNYIGNFSEAIEKLQQFLGTSLDIELTLVMCLFQQNQYQEAYNVLKKFNHSDTWYEKKAGWLWVLKKNIIEILLLMELNRLELVLSRTASFQKRFTKRLKNSGETRVLNFIQLANYYYEYPKNVTSSAFKERVEKSFEWVGAAREDIFVMSFYGWLKSKMEEKGLYYTTLELVQSN
jgi:tetratricopeptide (TPR) repeat protein